MPCHCSATPPSSVAPQTPQSEAPGLTRVLAGCVPAVTDCSCGKRAGHVSLSARRLWKGRSIFSRATENGPASCAGVHNQYTAKKCRPSYRGRPSQESPPRGKFKSRSGAARFAAQRQAASAAVEDTDLS